MPDSTNLSTPSTSRDISLDMSPEEKAAPLEDAPVPQAPLPSHSFCQDYIPPLPKLSRYPSPHDNSQHPTSDSSHSCPSHRLEIPSFVLERGSHLHTPLSNFPTKYLPPPGMLPYTADGVCSRSLLTYNPKHLKNQVVEEKWEWGLRNLDNPHIQIGQQVEVRQLFLHEKKWSRWERATVISKGLHRDFLGAEFHVYNVEVNDTSEIRSVSPFIGEIWDGCTQRPQQQAHQAAFFIDRIRTVFVSGFTLDAQTGERKSVWLPANITSSPSDPDIMVEFFSHAKNNAGHSAAFRAGRVLPYTKRTAAILRSHGESVGSESDFRR